MTVDLSGVLAAPADDGPRRALAATLEAANDPRGRLITLQLDASIERKLNGTTREYWNLDSLADALLDKHRAEWAKEIAPLVKEARFHRGFVESVTIDAQAFLANGQRLYALAPIRSVQLVNAGAVVAEVAVSPLVRQLAHLGLQKNGLGDAAAQALARSTQLGNLRLLDLSFNAITESGLEALAASQQLRGLVFVNLVGNPCGDPSETYGVDGTTGHMVPGTASLPPSGKALEAKHGELPWLHAPSRLMAYPPTIEDV
ncbi:MAG: hypothetical protein IPQ07_07105 [Myxococcales bacterium]|nr:hypothetical protein [Myxococcales bacterium]